jgi:hypothetical protein
MQASEQPREPNGSFRRDGSKAEQRCCLAVDSMFACLCCCVQDAEGCRLSHAAGTWLFEAAGIPAVKGDESGVTLEPCPGALAWHQPICLGAAPEIVCLSLSSCLIMS